MQLTTLASFPKAQYPTYTDALVGILTWLNTHTGFHWDRLMLMIGTLYLYPQRAYQFGNVGYTSSEGAYCYIINLSTGIFIEVLYNPNTMVVSHRLMGDATNAGMYIMYK